jgi:hypothetical protein
MHGLANFDIGVDGDEATARRLRRWTVATVIMLCYA